MNYFDIRIEETVAKKQINFFILELCSRTNLQQLNIESISRQI